MFCKRFAALLLCMMLLFTAAMADTAFISLPMDNLTFGPTPKDENYISDSEFVDESITVKIYEGRYADTDYVYAYVKISHPSQLRTIPASIVKKHNGGVLEINGNYDFKKNGSTWKGRLVAEAANAVIAMNGDYFTKDECKVVLRMGTQYRNNADSLRDLLIIDKNGDFSYLNAPSKADYAAYYEANQQNLYQVFCFGPVLVENGVNLIPANYQNGYIGAQKSAQRAAICQLGELEYMMIVCYGNQTKGNKGMTIPEFAAVCDMAGRELNPEGGCKLAFNLDGGNSTAMLFKQLDQKFGKLKYVKVNCPEIERFLSDIIYFATLVK